MLRKKPQALEREGPVVTELLGADWLEQRPQLGWLMEELRQVGQG